MALTVSLLIATVLLILLIRWFRGPNPKFPPFPRRPLPLVGNLLHLESNPLPLFKKWTTQCGDIFSLYLAGTHMVVLNGYDLIKEVFVKKADSFSDRPPFFVDEIIGLSGKGIILASGDSWREHRTVSMSILRSFGMGKNILAEKILEEVGCFMNYLADLQGQPTDIRAMTNISVCNVISSMVIGRRFDYDNKELQTIMSTVSQLTSDTKTCGVLNFMPWLLYIPGDLFKAKKIAAGGKHVIKLITKFIDDKRRDDVDEDNITNFIDAYIVEWRKKTSNGTPTNMDNDHMNKVIFDLFTAGAETTSTSIYWCILYILNHPQVQEKLWQQIEDVVGTARAPNMHDMPQLTYLSAFIMECQRLANTVPLSVTHVCSAESVVRGFTVPKGALVVSNLDSVLHSEKVWGADVMDFRPERFLDDQGKVMSPDEFIPFGIGRRVCIGESLAKMEMFLFLASILQRFELLPLDPASPPSTESKFGIITSPYPYQVRLKEREKLM